MVGVIAGEAEKGVVCEFFELFKVPWEFYREGSRYDVVICSAAQAPPAAAPLLLVYGASLGAFDREQEIQIKGATRNLTIPYLSDEIPLYGECLTFREASSAILHSKDQKTIAIKVVFGGSACLRFGFDLFAEIKHLLTFGQPSGNALIPTLDLHILLLRNLFLSHAISLREIPPIPAGYNFTVCLTHDIDQPGLKYHRFDHTFFGFLYRATLGSVFGFCSGRRSLRQLLANWKAACLAPFVQLGLTTDFWNTFRRYRELEGGSPSTFFVIPRRNEPGTRGGVSAPSHRAARYDLGKIKSDLQQLASNGCEVATHGIDAWQDVSKGQLEKEAVSAVSGRPAVGVRMHWLYFNEESPSILEKAGYSYDSTVGYNDTIGYRAGTSQCFKPLGVDRLLELPLHVMDTAAFFPSHMHLRPRQAKVVLDRMIANAQRFGGVLTINWHDRSIAPERLWDDTYRELLQQLREQGAWFATAQQAVSWFRKRRAARFDSSTEGFHLAAGSESDERLPALQVRLKNDILLQGEKVGRRAVVR